MPLGDELRSRHAPATFSRFTNQSSAAAELAGLKTQHATKLATQASDAQQREAKARADERRITFRVMETADAANLKAADAPRTAGAAGAAGAELDRLRSAYRAAFAAGGATETAAAAPGSPPAAGARLVLTRSLDRGGELLQSCAASLNQVRIAGLACERRFECKISHGWPAARTGTRLRRRL